jgi:proline iminopeptidase
MGLLLPHFYAKHVRRLPEWPDAVKRTFDHLNTRIHGLMQGPSEFRSTGRIASCDRTGDLPRITVPTLVVGATHDTMDPAHMEWMAGQVAHGAHLHCPAGSHMAMWDDQQAYFTGLVRWLQEVDAGSGPLGR